MRFFTVVGLLLILSLTLHAQERFEVGIGAGSTHEMAQDAFKTAASGGDGQLFWLGYGLDKNWAVELGLDQLDFDGINSKHKAISLAGVYRFMPENWVHPIAKLGVTSVESKSAADVNTGSFGLKAAAGIEADAFKYVSIGALFDFHYVNKSDSALDHKDTHAMMAAVFFTIHNALDGSDEQTSESTAPDATTEPAQESDADKKK